MVDLKNLFINIKNADERVKKRFNNKDLVSLEDFFCDYSDIIDDLTYIEDKIEEIKQNIEENYEPKKQDIYDFLGINKYDF